MENFRKSKIAVAIGAAVLATSANAVVVVGGDNGWEVSFDGNVNLFYNHIDLSTRVANGAGGTTSVAKNGANGSSSHLQEGLLPAFFSTNIKSPTVNGLTGTARISFAPDSSSAKATFNDKGGTAIDMREVVANVDGSFGTISFGRTLGLFARQAILRDMTLFGVGDMVGADGGGTTLGRIGEGYIYSEFRTRFSYKSPNINGFQLEVGAFDPQEPIASLGWATDTPKFEGEVTYSTTFTDGNIAAWVSGTWQSMHCDSGGACNSGIAGANNDVDLEGVDFGGQLNYMSFGLTGYYYTGQALGTDIKNGINGAGSALIAGAGGLNLDPVTGSWREADNDGFYAQGTYTFGGKTKVGFSYGETNQDSAHNSVGGTLFNDIEHRMWTVGVYHDMTSWLKLIAEYNNVERRAKASSGNVLPAGTVSSQDYDQFSVGAFMTW